MELMIIDYGAGNLRSVANAFEALGLSAQIAHCPKMLETASAIVLPGVGAFGDGMRNLQAAGWVDALNDQVLHKGKPFLGVCLGMQLLATMGTEHGLHAGLGWIPGRVERLPDNDPDMRIPHIGWNDVTFVKTCGLFAGLGESQTFYFVHSYAFKPEAPAAIGALCHYGTEFVAAVEQDNIWAVQFHPEKSQKAGLAIFQNFAQKAGMM